MSFPWLTVIGAVPLVGAAVVLALPSRQAHRAREIALGASLASLVLVVIMALQFKRNSSTQFQFAEVHNWIPQFGVSYALGVDGIGLVLIALAAVLTPVCLLAAWNDVPEVGGRQQNYLALMLVLQTMMVGVFAATDVFLFYVFFEAMLIPVYFLIGSFGGPQRQYAAVKFLLYSLAGGLLMLVAVIAVYFAGPKGDNGFLLTSLVGHLHFSETSGRLMFLGFFIAFAIKAPMVPVHTWLPDAAAEAPPATAVLLVGVLDKVGTFGMIRLCLPLFPDAAKWATPAVIVLAIISIVYGALLAIGQTDIMRLIAYTSVSHFGFIVMGIFAMTSSAQNGATLYMVNHGFSTAAMFLVAAMLTSRRGSRRIPDFGGWQRVTPLLAGSFLVAGLSSLALPGLSSFVSEFLVLVGTFSRYQVAAIFAISGIVLAALYILLAYQRMMTGPKPEALEGTPDMQRREAWVVAPVLAILLVLGLFPKPVLDVISPAVDRTMHQVGVTDPKPTQVVPAAEGDEQVIASVAVSAVSRLSTANPSLPAPKIDYGLVMPMLIVFGVALVSVLVEAFAPRRFRYPAQVTISIVGLLAAFVAVVKAANGHKGSTASGSIVVDGPTLFLQGTLLLLSVLGVLTMAERFLGGPGGDAFTAQGASIPGSPHEAAATRAGLVSTEVFPLTLFAVGGMMLFPAAGDLLTMFVALEVLSLPLYILCGLARRRRLLSQEASLKYFLLGAFSSAFFLFGSALLFGYAGSLNLGDIAKAITDGKQSQGLLLPGVALVGIGLLFKVGAVPFHSWTPDVYQGAPTPVTGFMAACTKLAAFGAILRVVYVGVSGSRWDWEPVLWGVAILTMLVGSVLAITQTDVKRMLAYSSIAHAGFVLVGVLSFDKSGVSGVLFYLAAYGFSTIGAFAVVSLVRDSGGEATHLSQWAGLGKRHPLVAGIFALFLLAFAGIPLTSGFTAKFAVFAPAVAHGATWLAVIGVLASAIAAFFYVRVIVLMYFSEPSGDATTVAMPSAMTTVALTIGVAVTVILGVFPQPVLDLAAHSALFVP